MYGGPDLRPGDRAKRVELQSTATLYTVKYEQLQRHTHSNPIFYLTLTYQAEAASQHQRSPAHIRRRRNCGKAMRALETGLISAFRS
jgi:hypothetical protein